MDNIHRLPPYIVFIISPENSKDVEINIKIKNLMKNSYTKIN